MENVIFDVRMSLDGFIAGPKDDGNPDRELGALDVLHAWMFQPQGNFEEIAGQRFKNVGAVVMGRRMFDPGEEPWGDDPVFHAPVFVLSHKFRVVVFPVITGSTGYERIYDGYPDVVLDMVASRTCDGRLQLLEYAPTGLAGPPGTDSGS